MDTNYSLSDIAALVKNGGFGSGDGLGWLILILLFMGGLGGGWGAGRGPAPMTPPNVATMNDVETIVNNQTVNSGLQQVLLSSANNNYENAQLMNNQTNTLMQQNYTNQINALQGFNSLGMNLTGGFNAVSTQLMNQTNQLSSKLDTLGHEMEQCCCKISTQLLQNQLDDANRKLVETQNKLSNMEQTQNILGVSGRWVGWSGSGTQTAGVVTA